MKRRAFLVSIASALCAPYCRAQQLERPVRIAYLTGYTKEIDAPLLEAFKKGLRERGYVEGRDVLVDSLHAGGQSEHLAQLAEELARRRPAIFVVGSGAAALEALSRVSDTTPIVMANVQDPLATGLVASLGRPGGNVTGLSDFHAASVTKRLELVKEAVPRLKVVGVLWNSDSATNAAQLEDLKRSAPTLGLTLVSLPVRAAADIRPALARLKGPNTALLLLGDFVLTNNMASIAKYAIEHRLPAVYTTHSWVEAGGFMAYGTNFEDLYRRAAGFVDKILKGAKPSDLPIEQAEKFDLVISLRTAKALGISPPSSLLQRADRVID